MLVWILHHFQCDCYVVHIWKQFSRLLPQFLLVELSSKIKFVCIQQIRLVVAIAREKHIVDPNDAEGSDWQLIGLGKRI